MEHINREVAARLIRQMSESRATNADLAAHLEMSEATLVRRLTSSTSFTIAEMAQASRFLGCSLADLIPTGTTATAESA